MGVLTIISVGLTAIVTLLIIYASHTFRKRSMHLKTRGIPYLGTSLSRLAKMLQGSLTLVQMDQEIFMEVEELDLPYAAVSDVFGGITIYVRDIELLNHICVKDFGHFVNRRPMGESVNKYMRKILFGLEGDIWKGTRTKISPCFSTGRIRRMFSIFQKSCSRMVSYINEQPSSELIFAEIFPKYSMDVIASCAFGVDSNCFTVAPSEKSQFKQMAARFFQFQLSGWVLLKIIASIVFPKICNAVGMEPMDKPAQEYFVQVIKKVMKQRRETGKKQDDLLQFLMDTMDGELEAEEATEGTAENASSSPSSPIKKVTFDEVDVIANAFMFMLAGFDATQSVLQFVFYQLALEQQIQQRLYESVMKIIDDSGGQVTYEGVNSLTYLDMVINDNEVTPTNSENGTCTKDFKIPGTDALIEKRTTVCVPIYCIHHDGRFFPEPEKFDPERFSPENKSSMNSSAFMPFGHGPRSCLGSRFALLNIKAAVAQLVYSFKWATFSKTAIPLELDNGANIKPKGGLWLKALPRL